MKPENQSRTLNSNPKASRQAPIADLLQTYNGTLGRQPVQRESVEYAESLAYKGSDIHVASGQEQHLPHEAWHIIQQKQARVQPTIQLKENDGKRLEKETDKISSLKLCNKKNNKIIHDKTILSNTIQRTKWKWESGRWRTYDLTPPMSNAPSYKGQENEVVDTAIRVVYASGSRVNEAIRALAHPKRKYDVSDIQSEEDVKKYPGYIKAAADLSKMGSKNRHGIDAVKDRTPSVLTHIPFLETGVRNGEKGTLTSEVMEGIFANQDSFQPEGHIITVDIYTSGSKEIDNTKKAKKNRNIKKNKKTRRAKKNGSAKKNKRTRKAKYYRMGQRYKIVDAASKTNYKLVKRLKINREITHVETINKNGGLEINQENSRRLFFVKDSSYSQSEKEMIDVLSEDDNASDYEDSLVGF